MGYICNKKSRIKVGNRVVINDLIYVIVQQITKNKFKIVLSNDYENYIYYTYVSLELGINTQKIVRYKIIKDKDLYGKEIF